MTKKTIHKNMANYEIDFFCLQETNITEYKEVLIKNYRLKNLQSNFHYYGNGI